MAFPVSPTDGQTATVNNIVYTFSTANNTWTRTATGFVNLGASGNISAIGNIYGNFIIGNITGNVTAVNAQTVTTNAQPNITSVGTLTSVTSSGLISTTGNIAGSYLFGNGSQLTNVVANTINTTFSGSANTFYIDFVAADGANNQAIWNSPFLTYIPISGILGASALSATGNITGNYIIGNGSTLTSLTGANITGTVANATYAVSAGSAVGTAATVTTNAQPNITSVGTLTSLTSSGLISTTGNVVGNYILGNGSQLTGIITSVSNVINGGSNLNIAAANANVTISVSTIGNVAVFAPTGVSVLGTIAANSNITGGNLLTAGLISATSTITSAANVIGGNITTAGLVTVTGNVTGGNLLTAGLISATSTITSAANVIGGNITTAGLVTATGNVTGGNLLTAGLISSTGNITANYYIGNGSTLTSLTGGNVTGTVANATYALSAGSAVGTAATITTNAQPNITSVGTLTSLTSSGLISTTGNVTGNFILGNGSLLTGIITSVSNVINGNSNVNISAAAANVTISVSGVGNIAVFAPTGEYVTGLVSASGNITGGNILTAGLISATSTITSAANITGGNLLTAGLISATSTITSAANVIGGNITSLGIMVGQNFIANTVTTTSSSANITLTATSAYNQIITGSASQNIFLPNATTMLTGAGFLVNVNSSQPVYIYYQDATLLATLSAGGATELILLSSSTANGTWDRHSLIPSYAGWGSSALTMGGANITGANNISVTGIVSATGNITGNNITTAGLISATGAVTGASILGLVVSATGNVIGGNILTAGLISATANIAGGNVLTGGLISATGNITGGNILTAGLISSTGNLLTNANLSVSGNATIVGSLNVQGNVTFIGSNVITTNDLYIQLANNQNTYANVNTAGLAVGPVGNVLTYWQYLNAANAWSTNVGISATANVTSGNLVTAGLITATGNITGNYIIGNGSTLSSITGGNVTGTVANATYAVSAGSAVGTAATVTTNAQPNITSVGTLTSITSSGLISTTGNVVGNYIIGNGALLTNINASNITGAYSNANVANYLPTYSGNITANNISITGNVTANYIIGNGSLLTSLTGANVTGTVANATYAVSAGSAVGTAATVTTNAQPNITSVGTLTSVTSSGLISTTGNVVGNYIIGNGATLSSITGGNVTGTVANATYAVSAGSAVGTAATITTNAQPNITSVGTLTSITSSGLISTTGNIVGANMLTAGLISAAGNINTSASINSNNIVGTNVTIASTGSLSLNPTANVDVNNRWIINLSNPVSAQDAATKSYVDAALSNIHYHAPVNAATTTTLTSTFGGATIVYNNGASGVGANLVMTGNTYTNIDGVNIAVANSRILVKNEANATWNGIYNYSNSTVITRTTTEDTAAEWAGGDVFFVLAGTVNDNTQWVQTDTVIAIGTSNISFTQIGGATSYTAGSGLSLTGTQFNACVDGVTTAVNGSNQISVKASANLTTPNIGVATGTSLSVTGDVTGGNLLTAGLISATSTITAAANITGGNLLTAGLMSSTGNAIHGNILTAGLISATSTITSAANVVGGNITTVGLISSTGTITGSSYLGAVVSVTANVTGGNILTAGIMSSTGNAINGNILTAGLISATGTAATGVNAAQFGVPNVALHATSVITSAGNSNQSSQFAFQNFSALANASADIAVYNNLGTDSQYFIDMGIVSSTYDGTAAGANVFNPNDGYLYVAGNSITGPVGSGANIGNLILGATTGQIITWLGNTSTANIVTVTSNTGFAVTGVVSATGNIAGGNILTAGLISATSTITSAANVIGGNITTAGLVTATGNVTGGNILTAGLMSSTGNIAGGNILTAGLISATSTITSAANIIGGNITTVGLITATGNVTGGNILTAGLMSSTGNAIHGNILTAGLISATSTITSAANVIGGNITTAGLVTATGNVTGGNILTAGLMSSTGNAIHGNILTAGLISATSTITSAANVIGGNITTVGLVTATGNVTGGNILTAGVISAAGNIILGTNGSIGIGIASPDTELNILANPQTVSYPVTGNSTAAGTDLHISGADGAVTRITQDSFGTGSYVAFTGRTGRGTAAAPSQTLLSDTLAQFTARGFSNGTLQFGNASTGRIDIVAAENFTDTSRATNVQIYTTAAASITPTAVATFSSASGLSVAGNVTATAYFGNGAALSGIVSGGGGNANIVNGTSNITIGVSAGNANVNIGGAANVAVFSNVGSFLTLAAGNTTVAPLALGNSATILTTPSLGAMEFANNQLYFTSFAGNRSIIPTPLIRVTTANISTTNVATGQSWLGAGVTLNANTTYQFSGQFYVTTTNTNSHVEQVGFGGTATLANITYAVTRFNANTALGTQGNVNTQYFFANTLSNITSAITTAQNTVITMSGYVSTTATGTFIPQWATNVAISTTGIFARGAYFQLTPLAQGNAGNISIGNWA